MESHEAIVNTIATSVRSFYDRRAPYRIYHGSTNSTRQSSRRPGEMVDTSKLTNVLQVDTHLKTALVEPNVPMDRLVQSTLAHGLVPPVVMEFPGITAGGGFAGTSGESSSFRHGFFERTVNWVEVVLANGDVVRASKTENTDLFHGAASSFGTMGVVTLLELQLVEAKKYVELTYHYVEHASEIVPKIEEFTKNKSLEYLDGIMFSKTSGLLITGRLVDKIPGESEVHGFMKTSEPWFYLHSERIFKRLKNSHLRYHTDYSPIYDYMFRYDRAGFWVGKYAFEYFMVPFNRITRFVLDYFMHTRVMYHALHKSGFSNHTVIQDVAIPYNGVEEFLEYLDRDFGHYPLWLCPIKFTGTANDPTSGLWADTITDNCPEYFLNFGVWGPGSTNRQEFIDMNRRLEAKLGSLGGKKWFYAQGYYTEQEFWKLFNRAAYDTLREKYHATHLPTIYDKVKSNHAEELKRINASWRAWAYDKFWRIWPLKGLYGVMATFVGRDYLLARTSPFWGWRKN